MEALLQGIAPFWFWLALACIFLALVALFMPSGFLLCLGSAAGCMAVVIFFLPSLSGLWSLSLFALFIVSMGWIWWKVLRKKRIWNTGEDDEERLNVKIRQLIGYKSVLDEDIKSGRGRVRVNDSLWPVESDFDYPAGTLVEVTEVRGIILLVKKV
jgi:membrane protein implicated in regulation of membrane protease activity